MFSINTMKKITKIFTVFSLSLLLAPAFASADTISDLQREIAILTAKLAALQNNSSYSYTNSCTATFSKTLQYGMTDNDVMNLQKALNKSSDTQVATSGAGSPGYETNFFGERTVLAVTRFQNKYASEIINAPGRNKSTAVYGIVDSFTNNKLNSLCSGVVLGDSTSNTTGTTVESNTSNNNTNGDGLNGGAGSIVINSYSGDVEDNVTTGTGKNVLGFKIRADGSDVKVTHARVVLTYSGSKNNYLTRYFQTFDIYMGSERIARISASEFNRDSSGVYSKTFALENSIVRMGSSNQKTFYVRAIGQNYVDTDLAGLSNGSWSVMLDETRYKDATGYSFQDGTNVTNSGVYVEKLSSSSEVKVKISTGSDNPDTKNVFVSDSSSGDKVTMLEFKLKAEGTTVEFDQIKTSVVTTGSAVSNQALEFQLLKNGTSIATTDSTSVSGGVITFNLDDLTPISQDDTATFSIVARMQKIGTGTFIEGSTMRVSFQSVNAQVKDGDSISSYSGSASGRTQTFRSTGLNLTRLSSSQHSNYNTNNPSASYAEFRMQVSVSASGEDIWVPLTIDSTGTTTGFVYNIEDSSNNVVTTGSGSESVTYISGGYRDGNYIKISDGDSAKFDIFVTFNPIATGQYHMQAVSAGYTTSGATGNATNQIIANPESTFETSNIYISN
jgi:hypothetical protein